MKFLSKHTTFLLVLVFCMICSLPVQAQYQKYLDKADEAYIEGDYEGALKQIEKMKKKVTKKLGAKNSYMAIALLKESKINLELGMLNDVVPPLTDALQMSTEVNDTLSTEHAFMLNEAAEIMIQFGNFRLADIYLTNAERVFESSGSLIENIQSAIDVMKAQILVGKGFNQEAIQQVDDVHDYYLQRAFATDGSRDDQEARKAEYASLMTVKAQAYANMGDVDEATRLFYDNRNWIDDNLKKSHILYAWNTFLDVEMMKGHGLSLDAQADYYEDAFNQGRKKYAETHWMVLLMNERLMSALFRNEQKGKFNIVEDMYTRAIRQFDRSSYHYLARDRMELELDMIAGDLRKVEDDLNDIDKA